MGFQEKRMFSSQTIVRPVAENNFSLGKGGGYKRVLEAMFFHKHLQFWMEERNYMGGANRQESRSGRSQNI